jgi:hypothetical protein
VGVLEAVACAPLEAAAEPVPVPAAEPVAEPAAEPVVEPAAEPVAAAVVDGEALSPELVLLDGPGVSPAAATAWGLAPAAGREGSVTSM